LFSRVRVMSDVSKMYDVIIIGAGFAGYAAAIYSARFNLKTLVIGKQPGGAIINSEKVENYPGFASIPGFELMQKFEAQAKGCGAEIMIDEVLGIVKAKDGFKVETRHEKEYKAKAIILALGTERRKLEVKGCEKFDGKGIHYCATCDGAFYRGKTVAVVGGSNSAAHAALLLSRFAKKVYVIYRGVELRCEPALRDKIKEIPHSELLCGFNITCVDGKEFLEKIKLDIPYKGKTELALDGIFVEIGSVPSSSIAKGLGVSLSPGNEIVVDQHCATNVAGIFAAGDVTTGVLKQGLTAAAQGAVAATSAYKHITGKVAYGASY
jgi:thioredoxin-disulfide reductase